MNSEATVSMTIQEYTSLVNHKNELELLNTRSLCILAINSMNEESKKRFSELMKENGLSYSYSGKEIRANSFKVYTGEETWSSIILNK